jgi:hypothetical protein
MASRRLAAEWAAAKSRPNFMRYVMVRPAKPPTIGDHGNRVELFGVPDEVKRQRLKDSRKGCRLWDANCCRPSFRY